MRRGEGREYPFPFFLLHGELPVLSIKKFNRKITKSLRSLSEPARKRAVYMTTHNKYNKKILYIEIHN